MVGRRVGLAVRAEAIARVLARPRIRGAQVRDEPAGHREPAVAQVEAALRSDPTPLEGIGFMKTLSCMVQDDMARRRAARALRRIVANRPGARLDRDSLRAVLRLANREMALTQQARMLAATREIFRFWHVAHRPFAIAALAAVTLHVAVVVVMGVIHKRANGLSPNSDSPAKNAIVAIWKMIT